MSIIKVLGLVGLGAALVAFIGGGAYVIHRRRKKKKQQAEGDTPQRVTPSKPPRADDEPSELDLRARGMFLTNPDLPEALHREIVEQFADAWPPDDETIDKMTTEDVIVVAVESEPVGPFTEVRHELITAKVRSVEQTVVRARVVGPVAYAEHMGSHAGHGVRVGDLIEVPRSKVLVAARSTAPKREGYNSEGEPAGVYDPSNNTKQTYKVRPGTPYDLALPYRTDELEWVVDRELVKMTRIGSKGNYEQIMFSEDSMRGPVTVRALDVDPKEGRVFVARWEFQLAP